MKGPAAAAALLLFTGFRSVVSAVAQDDRTITKVVKLLQGMLEKSKADGDADREIFAKFKCYCDTQKETKTQEIAALTKQIEVLSSRILEIQGSTGSLSTECAGLKRAIAENEQVRREAEDIRTKEHASFVATEADLQNAIAQMEKALEVLSEIGADQTLSEGADHTKFMAGFRGGSLLRLRGTVKEALSAASSLLKGEPRRKVESLLQAPFTGTYTAQSGEVVGILKNMRDTFKSNLQAAVTAETAQAASHEKFMATKVAEYGQLQQLYNEKQDLLGSNDGELASKRRQLDDSQNQKEVRESFMAQLVPTCSMKASEYQQRTALRGNEDAAISEAIAILNSDSAFAALGTVAATSSGATGPALVQLAAISRHTPSAANQQKAVELLRSAAGKVHSLRLVKLAALLESGTPFDAVLQQMQRIVGLLDDEGRVDKQKLDWCNAEREASNAAVDAKTAQIVALTADITSLTTEIEGPETGLKAQIEATEVALDENAQSQKAATAQREAERAVYEQDLRELATAQELLHSASSVLKKYYEGLAEHARDEAAPAVLAGETEAVPETWEGEKGFKGQSNDGSKVIGMLDYILEQTQKEEDLERKSEADSQAAYEGLMAELTTEQTTLQTSLVTLKKTLAEKEQELMARQEDLKNTEAEKAAVEAYLRDIAPGCDFITANYDLRETHRAAEKTALLDAEAALKGTPAYKSAVAAADRAALGECLPKCEENPAVAVCKACLAHVTVPAYCAGHPGTEGC